MSQAKRMVKHSTIYAVGNISRQLVGFLMLPVYTRFLSPADYGVVGLLIFMVSLIELLFGGHMFNAVPKYYYDANSEAQRKKVLSTALFITGAISTTTVLLVGFFSDQVSGILFGKDTYATIVSMFAVLILTHALENYALVYIRIQQKPWLFVGASLSKLVLQLSLNIYFVVVLEMGVYGIAVSTMSSSLIFSAIMTTYTLKSVGFEFGKNICITLLRFSWPLWIGGIAGLYIGSANRYYLRTFSSLNDVGLFELAAKFSGIVFLLVWTPFLQYWQTERFRIQKDSNAIYVYQTVFKIITFLLFSVGVGVSLFSKTVIDIMASSEFGASSNAVAFLVFAAIFNCLTTYNNFSFLLKEKTTTITKNSYITAGIITVFFFILIPAFGFVGAAAAALLANIIQFTLIFFSAKRCYDMKLNLPNLIYTASVSFSAIYCAHLIPDLPCRGVIFVITGLLIVLPLYTDKKLRNFIIQNFIKPRKKI